MSLENIKPIPVLVNGGRYITFIDIRGKQRFVGDRAAIEEFESSNSGGAMLTNFERDIHEGRKDIQDFISFLMSIGWTVDGITAFDVLRRVEVINPAPPLNI